MLEPRHNCCADAEWKQHPRLTDYEISTCGRIRTGDKLPAISVTPRGYAVSQIAGKTRVVHTLVLETFVGSRPDGQCACHYDGEKTNNHLSNLRWDTLKGNFRDRDRHGTTNRGSRLWSSRLTEKDIPRIRQLHGAGWSQSEIGRLLDISSSSICRILNGQSWKHV